MAFRKSIGYAVIVAILGVMALTFQNCAKSGFGQALGDPNPGSGLTEWDSNSPDAEAPPDDGSNPPSPGEGGIVIPGGNGGNIVAGTRMNFVTINSQNYCPGNSYPNGDSCVRCGDSDYFDKDAGGCIRKCQTTQKFNPATGACVTCGSGLVWTGQMCIAPPSGCSGGLQEIRALSATDMFVLPPKTDKICYFAKLFSAVPKQATNTSRTRMTNVLARDLSQSSDTVSANPFILGDKSLNVYMQAAYSLVVASSPRGSGDLQVDNFALLDVLKQNAHSYIGVGTSNSLYRASDGSAVRALNPITNAWTKVSYTSVSNGSFPATDITKYTSTNTPLTIRMTVLDCGGQEFSTEGYLLFK